MMGVYCPVRMVVFTFCWEKIIEFSVEKEPLVGRILVFQSKRDGIRSSVVSILHIRQCTNLFDYRAHGCRDESHPFHPQTTLERWESSHSYN